MPKRWKILSLQKMCLEELALNGRPMWIKDYREGDLAFFHVQDLIKLLGHNKDFFPSMLHLLLGPQLRDLDLTACRNLITKSIALTIRVRCRNLSSLNLHGCKQISAHALAQLVESLPRLIVLDLSKTLCNRQVLSAVGVSCQQLRGLNISLCRRLSLTSLFYLAYDPLKRSFSCQTLQKLCISGLKAGRGHCWALVFVLLALPSLTYLVNNCIPRVLHLIHKQQFDRAQLPPGFPPLTELVQHRIKTHREKGISELTLALGEITGVREITGMRESILPLINAICPYLTKVTIFLGDRPALTHSFVSWRYLTDLTIICDKGRDLSELLPVTENLGAQLRILTIRHFFFTDEFSFHALVSRCTHLQEFQGTFLSPRKQVHGMQVDIDTLDWNFSLPRLEFPQLSHLILEYTDMEIPLPYRHAMVLRQSLVNLLKESPQLKFLELHRLPFSLDQVFKRVLNPPGPALRHIGELVLSRIKVSMQVINLILSSENELSYLCLLKCPGIDARDYSEILKKVEREGFDMEIKWK